ncbi:MAG: winged helix-turn-helix transcriptional regulator [Candidatus Eremiobacteraeota bacterium]|nr:winged helix-turn-helix transcriptional regulator [Candidatus Eremiobacteraeota bacterium]MBV9055112.1 winged helix-turn-helix transcriptional regulator [Candidatus Eremiobacteraeota bacterium]
MFGTTTLDSIFSALGDPTRRRMVERLARGPLSISDVSAGFSISQPAISKHVKILERSGLVRRDVVGREHRLRLSPVAMESASSWIERQRSYWTAALDRLDAYLKPAPPGGRRKKWAPTS